MRGCTDAVTNRVTHGAADAARDRGAFGCSHSAPYIDSDGDPNGSRADSAAIRNPDSGFSCCSD